MCIKASVDFAAIWCSRLINLCKDQSTKHSLEVIKNYFTSINELPQLNTARVKLINDVYKQLLVIHESPMITDKTLSDALQLASSKIEKTAKIISKPDEKLVAKLDRLLLTALSNFYSCFGSVFLTISCSHSYTDAKETMSSEKCDLLDELLTTARDDVIMELIKNNMPYDQYFSQDIFAHLRAGQYEKNDCTRKTYGIIQKIEQDFKLPRNWLVQFITCDPETHVYGNATMAELLRNYIQKCDKEGETSSVSDFVTYTDLKCTVNEEHFCVLFKSYAEKVRLGTIGYMNEQTGNEMSMATEVTKDQQDVDALQKFIKDSSNDINRVPELRPFQSHKSDPSDQNITRVNPVKSESVTMDINKPICEEVTDMGTSPYICYIDIHKLLLHSSSRIQALRVPISETSLSEIIRIYMEEKASDYNMVETPQWIPSHHFEFHLMLYVRKRLSNQSIVDFMKKMGAQSTRSQYEIISKGIDFLLFYYRLIPGNTGRNLSWKEFYSLRYSLHTSKQIELFALTTQEEFKPINDIVDNLFPSRVANTVLDLEEIRSSLQDPMNVFTAFDRLHVKKQLLKNSPVRTVTDNTSKKLDFNNILRECKVRIHSGNVQFITDKIPIEHFSSILNPLSNIARGVKTPLYVESSFVSDGTTTEESIEDDRDSLTNS